MTKNIPQSERAKRILSAAEPLFLKHGYTGTSLQMLIDEAGGSRRTIYSEFGNKEGLFKAVVKQKISDMVLILSVPGDMNDPKSTLVKVCQMFLVNILQPDMLALFKLMLNTVSIMPGLGDSIYQDALVNGPSALANYLERLDLTGIAKIDDPFYASQLLLAMVKGHLHTHCLLDPSFVPSEIQISQHVEQAVNIFLDGVLQ